MIAFLQQFSPVTQALFATLFTYGVTAAGAGLVFMNREINQRLLDALLGFAAGVMIAAASLPVAGNVYILSQYFGVAAHRVSAAILISTAASILTVTTIIAWITG